MWLSEGIRKVARMGEFQELAWLLKFELISTLSAEQQNTLLADFIYFAEANQLGLAGHLGDFTVVSFSNRQRVTEAEQRLIMHWLMARQEVSLIHNNHSDNELSDAWLEVLLVDESAIRNLAFEKFFQE